MDLTGIVFLALLMIGIAAIKSFFYEVFSIIVVEIVIIDFLLLKSFLFNRNFISFQTTLILGLFNVGNYTSFIYHFGRFSKSIFEKKIFCNECFP
jgi:hypothetical protein